MAKESMPKLPHSIRRVAIAAGVLALVFAVAGCLPRDFDAKAAATPQTASGLYLYRWKSGDIEALQLLPDMTYKHSLYPDASAFAAGKTTHSSQGKWFATSKGSGALNVIHFTNYFSMFDDRQDERPVPGSRPFHEFTLMWNPFIEAPRALLQYSDDPGYWFVRESDASHKTDKG